ncbi:hypothetical protein NL676_027758 [Syzygium grande]|nr:hypothetical protein NL676_027758 [Syzygium grande]
MSNLGNLIERAKLQFRMKICGKELLCFSRQRPLLSLEKSLPLALESYHAGSGYHYFRNNRTAGVRNVPNVHDSHDSGLVELRSGDVPPSTEAASLSSKPRRSPESTSVAGSRSVCSGGVQDTSANFVTLSCAGRTEVGAIGAAEARDVVLEVVAGLSFLPVVAEMVVGYWKFSLLQPLSAS